MPRWSVAQEEKGFNYLTLALQFEYNHPRFLT